MAKGTKNYFRHSIFMHEDPKIIQLVRVGGMAHYGRYCVLIELMCGQEIQDSVGGCYKFHEQLLRKSLGLNQQTLKTFLEYCQNILGMFLEYSEHSVQLRYDKVLKYMGSYDSSSPKERKEKEIKEKKIKLNKTEAVNVGAIDELAGDNFRDDFLKSVGYDVQKSWLKNYDRDFVIGEFSKIESWVLANSKKAPKSNFARFITGWLSRGWETHRKNLPSAITQGKETAQQRQDRILNYEYPEI
jgi:hypothetical protein